jgi:hypothetical protein
VLLYSCKFKENTPTVGDFSKIDFTTSCDSFDNWRGGIQGVHNSDSTGIFPMAECHTNESYDLIWKPKGNFIKFKKAIGSDGLNKYYETYEKENYDSLDCYAFVIPKKPHKAEISADPNCDCEDLDTFDYVFPSKVLSYKRETNGWKLISMATIKSFEELGAYKLKTIHNN